jgi:two-component system, LytTR family, response regulator
MKTINAIIIDDEELGRNALKTTILRFCPYVNIIAEASNCKDAIELININEPNLIFLDIDLGDGTGFDVLRACKIKPKTIFVTAHNDFAIKAFKFNAIDYILKPFDPLDLVESIAKSIEHLEISDANLPEKTVVESYDTKLQKIVVPTSNGFEVLSIDEIEYLEADNNYTTFYLTNGSKKLVSKTLKYYDDLLNEFDFFRSHQSYLVNSIYIKEYIKGEGGLLIMKNGSEIDVSRRKKEDLIALISKKYKR